MKSQIKGHRILQPGSLADFAISGCIGQAAQQVILCPSIQNFIQNIFRTTDLRLFKLICDWDSNLAIRNNLYFWCYHADIQALLSTQILVILIESHDNRANIKDFFYHKRILSPVANQVEQSLCCFILSKWVLQFHSKSCLRTVIGITGFAFNPESNFGHRLIPLEFFF